MSAASVTAIWPAEFMFCFPSGFPPMSLVPHDRSQSLPEAFVVRGKRLGEKQDKARIKTASSTISYKARRRQGKGR
jgi:hypothetical protein